MHSAIYSSKKAFHVMRLMTVKMRCWTHGTEAEWLHVSVPCDASLYLQKYKKQADRSRLYQKKKNYNRQTFPQIRVPISRLQLNLRINQRTNKLNGLHCTLINCKIEDKVQTLNIAINLGPAVVYNYRHLHAQQLKAKYL